MRSLRFVRAGMGGAMMVFAMSGMSAYAQTATHTSAPQHAPAAKKNAAGTPTVLELRALDKITGHATVLYAQLNKPVSYETLTITARKCYSTPPSEPPQTSAFLQIEDRRPGQKPHQAFSGWMYASSPGINGMEHPLYDVWVVKCRANAPDQAEEPKTEVTVSPQDAADGDIGDDPDGNAPETSVPSTPKADDEDTGH